MIERWPHIVPKFYWPEEFAKLAHISRSEVYELMAEGIVPFTAKRPRRIPREWADKYVENLIAEAINGVTSDDDVADARIARRGRVVRR